MIVPLGASSKVHQATHRVMTKAHISFLGDRTGITQIIGYPSRPSPTFQTDLSCSIPRIPRGHRRAVDNSVAKIRPP